ncbi:putative ATP-dependent helicase C23E6.02 [Hordeum vulgare]|nr:putative ATP-dependent helicase C23E6.02 [Hordeum vulgare]
MDWSSRHRFSVKRRRNTTAHEEGGGLFSSACNFSGASNSRSSLTPIKREWEELPPLCAVKREPKGDAKPELRGGGIVGKEDFLPPAQADAIKAAILAQCASGGRGVAAAPTGGGYQRRTL